MPKKPQTIKTKESTYEVVMPRQKIDINWDLVEKMIEADCSGRQIAGKLRIDKDTFFDRFKEKYGKGFSDISDNYDEAGKGHLKLSLHAKAIGGNVTALMFLARTRLGMREPENINTESPNQKILDQNHENMLLKAELEEMKAEINAYKSKTG